MIEVRDLVHRYEGIERPAVDGVTLSVDDGEFLVLAGPNGSGKTTLVRHFNGLLDPDDGEVLVNGRSVGEDLVAARTAVGMVFQRPRNQFVAVASLSRAFARADRFALALRARCFAWNPTLPPLAFGRADYVVLAAAAALAASALV